MVKLDPRTVRIAAVGMMAGSVVLMLMLQFVPWHSWQVDAGSFEFEGTSGLWGYHERADQVHNNAGWFESPEDGDELGDGVASLRAGAILVSAALALGFACVIGLALDAKWGQYLAPAVAVVLLAGTILSATGAMRWANIHIDRSWGYGIAVLTSVFTSIGAMLAFLPAPPLGWAKAMQEWADADGDQDASVAAKPAGAGKASKGKKGKGA